MARSTFVVICCGAVLALIYGICQPSGADQVTPTESKDSIHSYLQPGQRLMHTRFEGGLVRLEVVSAEDVAAAQTSRELLGEWPTVEKVASDHIVLRWDNAERSATQILSVSSVLEVWLDNDLKSTDD